MVNLRKILIATLVPFSLMSDPSPKNMTWSNSKIEETSNDLEQRLDDLAEVEVLNPGGEGAIYLVGQFHATPVTTKNGTHYEGTVQSALVQAQIYHILLRLRPQLIMGEGLGAGEFTLSRRVDWSRAEVERHERNLAENIEFTVRYFIANPKELAYTSLDIFYPEIKVYGANDSKEMQNIEDIDKQQFLLGSRLSAASRDPSRFIKLSREFKNWQAEADKIHDQRSRIYMDEGIAIADQLRQPKFTIVIGNSHLLLMAQEYHGKRKLYVIRPHGVKGK